MLQVLWSEVLNGLSKPSVRSVVYTRKSFEEGLDQGVNSLDVQYDACTAYVASQRHENRLKDNDDSLTPEHLNGIGHECLHLM